MVFFADLAARLDPISVVWFYGYQMSSVLGAQNLQQQNSSDYAVKRTQVSSNKVPSTESYGFTAWICRFRR